METPNDIANAFQALSVLLVFVTLLFSMKYSEFEEDTNLDNFPDSKKPDASRQYRNKIKTNFIKHLFPVLVISFLCSYLVTPSVYKIIISSSISFINFDFFRTAFVLFSFLLYCFTATVIKFAYLYCKLLKRY